MNNAPHSVGTDGAEHDPQARVDSAPVAPPPVMEDEILARELQQFGSELMLRASDNCTLVAFAAIALQQIRGRVELHHDIASGLLLFSALLCAVVHFALGNAYLSQGRKLARKKPAISGALSRRIFTLVAWTAGIVQFVCVVTGMLLIIPDRPPAFMEPLIDLFR